MKKSSKMILGFMLALLCLFQIPVYLFNGYTPDDEPNNTFAQAQEVPSGEHMKGTLMNKNGVDYRDYYKANCLAGTTTTITKISTDPGGDILFPIQYYIYLYDQYENEIRYYLEPSTINIQINTSGYYYFCIMYDSLVEGGYYDYTITYTEGPEPPPPPTLEWITPEEDETVIFGTQATELFNFSYSFSNLDTVELYLNEYYIDDVTSQPGQVEIDYDERFDGTVIAKLEGYVDSQLAITAERTFEFAKINWIEEEVLNQSVLFVGKKLYSILYDPNGDLSYSGWESSSKFSMGVGMEVSASYGVEVGAGFDIGICSGDTSFSYEATAEVGFDFRLERTTTTEVTSSKSDDDPLAIGPGHGDIYWGETWNIPWKLVAQRYEFFNGSTRYIDPIIKYGIDRSSISYLLDYQAPEEWRAQSVVHQGYPAENVTWLTSEGVPGDGGTVYHSESIATTVSNSLAFTIDIGAEASSKINGGIATGSSTVSMHLSTRVYLDSSAMFELKKFYSIQDDDFGDFIQNDIGYDRRYGTYVYRTVPETCLTSNPHEIGTTDYQAPVISAPTINFDSSGDGAGPHFDDTPEIIADINDESGVKNASIYYTTDAGLNWLKVDMIETAVENRYSGSLPAFSHGTLVEWFIQAKDFENHVSTHNDTGGLPYTYTVENIDPTITVLDPNGGETFTGNTIVLNWTGSDQDGDTISYSIDYNLDNQGWHQIVTDLTTNSYVWNITDIYYADAVQIRITVTDSEGGSSSDTNDYAFSINRIDTNSLGPKTPLIIFPTLIIFVGIIVYRKKK